jgi:hypothetical protein
VANIVNECGRTLAGGNIDIGEQTEIALAAGGVTQVKNGSDVTVTISQRDASGVGPFTCDLDLTSNANGVSGQTPLTVTQDNASSGTGDVAIKVAMPADLACTGGRFHIHTCLSRYTILTLENKASTGNVCTVRCKNAANFGGCFAVQQTDITPKENTPQNIATTQTLGGILDQVQQNQKDLPAAVSAIQGSSVDQQGVQVADAILAVNPEIKSASDAADAGSVAGGAATGGATNSTAGTGNTGNARTGNGRQKNNANNRGNRNNNNNKRAAPINLRWSKRFVTPSQEDAFEDDE